MLSENLPEKKKASDPPNRVGKLSEFVPVIHFKKRNADLKSEVLITNSNLASKKAEVEVVGGVVGETTSTWAFFVAIEIPRTN